MARDSREPGDLVEEGPSGFDQARRFGPALVLAVVALVFVLQNTEDVHVEFLWGDFEWPLWIMLVLFAVIGAVVFWAWNVRRRRRRRDD